jgi:hypothetical protein
MGARHYPADEESFLMLGIMDMPIGWNFGILDADY